MGNKKFVIILGDSMTKLVNSWKTAKRRQANCKIYVKTFSEQRLHEGGLYEIVHKKSPDRFILHVDTNDLFSEKCSMKIAKSSIILTCRLKNEIHDVSVSTIILRTDDKILNERGMQVDLHLKELSKENNIFFNWQLKED